MEPEGWPSMAPLAAGKLGADLGAIIGAFPPHSTPKNKGCPCLYIKPYIHFNDFPEGILGQTKHYEP